MSRLRRLVLSDRFFFLSVRVLPARAPLTEHEFATFARVVRERRKEYGFLLAAWVFLPDHWHAIIYPDFPLTISRVLEAIKVGATLRINRWRGERWVLLQGRFFDRALRTVREYYEKAEYIHLNRVKAGLVERLEMVQRARLHEPCRHQREREAPSPSAASTCPPTRVPEYEIREEPYALRFSAPWRESVYFFTASPPCIRHPRLWPGWPCPSTERAVRSRPSHPRPAVT